MSKTGAIHSFSAGSGDEWEQACCDSFVPLNVNEVSPNFQGSLRTAFLSDNLHIATAASGGSTIFRGKRRILTEPRDNILLSYYLSGSGSVRQYNRIANLDAHSGAFYYSESPYTLGLGPMRQVVIQIDRKSLHLSDQEIRNLTARPLEDKSSPSLRILARIAEELLAGDSSDIAASECETISHAVLVLLRGLGDSLLSSPSTSPFGGLTNRMLTRQAALTCMDLNFTNASITPQYIADSLHISRRHLYDVLEEVGLTPASYIRELRLERAAELLSSGFLVEVAMRKSGFSSVATFRRVFRQKYDFLPSHVPETSQQRTQA